jgi:hypothetical protein
MAIRLKVTQANRKLQDLVRGDVFFFPNNKRLDETVVVIDKVKGDLFTRRIRYNDRTRENVEERVLYHLEKVGEDFVFNNASEGYVNYFKVVKEKRK